MTPHSRCTSRAKLTGPTNFPPASTVRCKKDFGKELRNTPWLGVYYLNMNNKLPEFKDKRVRQALTMVIDRDILTQKVTGNGETPAYSLFVKGTDGGTPTVYAWQKEPMAQRVAEAKKAAV